MVPADFLLDEAGTIECAFYGRDIGDHLPMADLLARLKPARVLDAQAH